MGLKYHKSVLFNAIEQIMNFPVIYDYPYLLHLVKNVSQMGQKMGQNPLVTGIILALPFNLMMVLGPLLEACRHPLNMGPRTGSVPKLPALFFE